AKLDLSPPGAEGEPRTMHHGPIPADWFSGNITVDALEMLAGFISRVSPQANLDVWGNRDGFESQVRDMGARLRRGDLTTAMAKALLDAHGKRLKAQAEALQRLHMTPDEIAKADRKKADREREAQYTKLRDLANDLQDHADKIGATPEAVRDILV